jgi:hypothetical protein
MPKPLKPCKHGRNPTTGRCYNFYEAQKAHYEAKWAAQEREWERQAEVRARESALRLEQARKRELLAGRVAGAEYQVAQRRADIERRFREAALEEEWKKNRLKAVQTAQKLLRQLDRMSGKTPAEIREREQLDESVRRTTEMLRQASEEAFYKRRTRPTLSGLGEARPCKYGIVRRTGRCRKRPLISSANTQRILYAQQRAQADTWSNIEKRIQQDARRSMNGFGSVFGL